MDKQSDDDVICFSSADLDETFKGRTSHKKVFEERYIHGLFIIIRKLLVDDHKKLVECERLRLCNDHLGSSQLELELNREERLFNNLKYAKIELNDVNEKIVEAKKEINKRTRHN